jgi:hypothetical protein
MKWLSPLSSTSISHFFEYVTFLPECCLTAGHVDSIKRKKTSCYPLNRIKALMGSNYQRTNTSPSAPSGNSLCLFVSTYDKHFPHLLWKFHYNQLRELVFQPLKVFRRAWAVSLLNKGVITLIVLLKEYFKIMNALYHVYLNLTIFHGHLEGS